jgi:hypothetical protein
MRWSGDGKSISYGGSPRRQPTPLAFSGSPLYLSTLGSSESARLLSKNVIGPFAWSPDEKWIAHGCSTEQTQTRARIRLCFTEVGNQENPRILSEGASPFSVSWSPDGTRFAYVVRDKASKSIFVAGTDGSPAKALTDCQLDLCSAPLVPRRPENPFRGLGKAQRSNLRHRRGRLESPTSY